VSNRRKPTAAKPRGDVIVVTVAPTTVSTYFHNATHQMRDYDEANGRRIRGFVTQYSGPNISGPRNEAVEGFLSTDAEWMLWLDSDMFPDPDLVDALLFNASPDKAPIVGALCYGINDDALFPTIYQLARTEQDTYVTVKHQGPIPEATMLQVAATGAAALLVHRSVYEAMAAREFNKVYPWFQETELFGRPCGEDFTFCLRAGQCGFPVYVNTAVEVKHHKSTLLTAEKYQTQVKEAAGA